MAVVLRARHAHAPPLCAPLEAEVRFEDIAAIFRLENGNVVATPDEGAEVNETEGCFVIDGWIITHDDPAPFAPDDERERALFEALAARPNDDDVRLVYSDWLEESGHASEAEVFALERQLRRHARDVHGIVEALRRAAFATTFAWRAVATCPTVHGCDRDPKNALRSWEKATPTTDPFIRHCEHCDCNVIVLPAVARVETYRDQGFHVALDVASSTCPIATTTWDESILDLPFFAGVRPPATIGEAMRALALLPHDGLQPEHHYGIFNLPEFRDPPPSNVIAAAYFGYAPGTRMYSVDPQPLAYAIAEKRPFTRVALTLARPFPELEDWLEKHFGKPHFTTEPTRWPGDEVRTPYRVYEHWRITTDGKGLLWENPISEWALRPRDEEAACEFLRQLRELLSRWRGCSFEQLERFALHPPEGAGIEAAERLAPTEESVTLDFRPPMRASAVVDVFDLADMFVEHDGVDSVTSTIRTRRSKHYHRWPQFGKWLVELVLTGEDNDRVSSRSRIRRLRVFRPY